MNDIDLSFVGYAGYFLAIGLVAIGAIAFLRRRSNDRHRKTLESRCDYNCLSAKMAWGGSNDPADDRIKRILADRAARRPGTIK